MDNDLAEKIYAVGIDDAGIEIMRLHYMAQKCAQNAIDYAIKAGHKLTERKKVTPHGKWLPYVKSLHIHRTTATNYMRIAKHSNEDGHLHLSIQEALKYLAPPKEKKEPANLSTSGHEKKISTKIDKEEPTQEQHIVPEESQETAHRSFDIRKETYSAANSNLVAMNLGLKILSSLRALDGEIEKEKATPMMTKKNIKTVKQYCEKITKNIEEIDNERLN